MRKKQIPLIKWTEKFSVGIDDIDEQHRKWISIANELHNSIMDGKSLDSLKKFIIEMEEYSDYHFSSEEDMPGKINWPASWYSAARYSVASSLEENLKIQQSS